MELQMIRTVIKAKTRTDMWNYKTNQPVEDTTPVGYIMDVDGRIPEGFIEYKPNRIFDRRKYPELYALFGKDHLPSEFELKLFTEKHSEWYKPKKQSLLKRIFNIFKK